MLPVRKSVIIGVKIVPQEMLEKQDPMSSCKAGVHLCEITGPHEFYGILKIGIDYFGELW